MMEEYILEPYKVYALTDDAGRIVAINSSAFLQDTEGWTLIDEGYGDRFHHAQGNYLSGGLMDDRGLYRYRLDGTQVLERTQEEVDADYIEPAPAPDLAQQVAELQESNRQLQEALERLLAMSE